ncbi:MAG TPA: hypothetical protein VF067_03305, partial [Sphingomicrobium sp.]
MGGKDISFAELREKLANDLLLIFLALGLPIGLASTARTFGDGDTSWHVAVGQWIFQHGQIPTADQFSFTAYGKPWVAMEWPADLLFAGVFRLAGYAGLAAIVAAAIIALNAILLIYLRSRVGPIGLTLAIIGMDIILSAFMLARPHVLVWPILAAWTVLLAKSSETGRPPRLWSALILTVWANLHGSFPIAAVIGGFLALDALIAAQWKTLREWLVFAGVCLVAICLQVNGIDGILQPFRVANLKTLHLIVEWLPSTTKNSPQFYGALLLVLGILLWRGVRIPIGRLLLLLAMLFLAFTQLRHQSWFAIVAAVIIPPLFGKKTEQIGKSLPILVAAVPLLLARALWPLTPPESVSNPRSLLAAVPAELKSQPVFNEYSFGGPLILAGIKPYIDGRSELYGDDFMTDYTEIAQGDWGRFSRAVNRYNIRWAVLPTGEFKLRN